MKEKKTARLRLTYGSKTYTVVLNSVRYAQKLIINKLRIGYAHVWLVFQNGSWRFIGDMPLCRQLKDILVRRIAAFHGLSEQQVIAGRQPSFRTGILLNVVLNALEQKNNLPGR